MFILEPHLKVRGAHGNLFSQARLEEQHLPEMHNLIYHHSALSSTTDHLCWASERLTLHLRSLALSPGPVMNPRTDSRTPPPSPLQLLLLQLSAPQCIAASGAH